LDAIHFVQTSDFRQGYKIACLEENALSNVWMSREQLLNVAEEMNKNSHGKYIIDLVENAF